MLILLSHLLACGFAPSQPVEPDVATYPLTGIVTGVKKDAVVVAHDDIDGLMPAMTMELPVHDASVLGSLEVGTQIAGKLVVPKTAKTHLTQIEITKAAKPADKVVDAWTRRGVVPLGEVLPATPVMAAVGEPVTIGAGQQGAWAVTFLYTRCPIPEFCPMVASKMAALQHALPAGARALAVTLDPDFDSRGVLRDYGERVGAVPGRWDLGRMPKHNLVALAERLGLEVAREKLEINHGLLLVLIDEEGRVFKRYRDMQWSVDEVVAQLQMGQQP